MKTAIVLGKFYLAIATAFLVGCSVTGNIKPVSSSKSEFDGAVYSGETSILNTVTPGGTEYRMFNQGATSFVPLQANREDAEFRAKKFCEESDKKFRALRETVSKPPHILGNFPRVELVFECVEATRQVESKYDKLAALNASWTVAR